jgi:hypothetical protein
VVQCLLALVVYVIGWTGNYICHWCDLGKYAIAGVSNQIVNLSFGCICTGK